MATKPDFTHKERERAQAQRIQKETKKHRRGIGSFLAGALELIGEVLSDIDFD